MSLPNIATTDPVAIYLGGCVSADALMPSVPAKPSCTGKVMLRL